MKFEYLICFHIFSIVFLLSLANLSWNSFKKCSKFSKNLNESSHALLKFRIWLSVLSFTNNLLRILFDMNDKTKTLQFRNLQLNQGGDSMGLNYYNKFLEPTKNKKTCLKLFWWQLNVLNFFFKLVEEGGETRLKYVLPIYLNLYLIKI